MILPGEIVVQQVAWERACKDAERYRWLRREGQKQNDIAVSFAEVELDQAIDFEVAKENDLLSTATRRSPSDG